MVARDIYPKISSESEERLDEMLRYDGASKRAEKSLSPVEVAINLMKAITEYILDGTMECRVINKESEETKIYCEGNARSSSVTYSLSKRSFGKYVYDLKGEATIKGEKIEINLYREESSMLETYKNEKEIDEYKYKRQEDGLHRLRELARNNRGLYDAILYLERQLHKEGIEGERINMKYDTLDGEYRIKVCRKGTFNVGMECIEFEGNRIELYVKHCSEYKPTLSERERLDRYIE
jgi:hypothetical protein